MQLHEAGLPSEGRPGRSSPPARPHITLMACADIETERLDPITEIVRDALPMPLVLGSPLIFGRSTERRPGLILVRQVLPSIGLLELQQQVAGRCPPAVDRHFDAGSWAPHVTLGRRYAAEQIGPAVTVLGQRRHDLAAQATGCRYWRGDLRQATQLV